MKHHNRQGELQYHLRQYAHMPSYIKIRLNLDEAVK